MKNTQVVSMLIWLESDLMSAFKNKNLITATIFYDFIVF